MINLITQTKEKYRKGEIYVLGNCALPATFYYFMLDFMGLI